MADQPRHNYVRAPLLAAISLGGITLVYSAGLHVTNATIVALSYLLVVLLTAASSALWLAIAESIVAVLLLNYFFLPPVGTWTIADPQNWVALFVLLVISVVASNLSSSAQFRAREAMARRDELSRLFDLSRDILLTTESEEGHQQLAQAIAKRFDLLYVAICLPGSPAWRILEAGAGRFTLPHDQLEAVIHAAAGTLESDGRAHDYRGRQTVHSQEGPPVDLVPLRLAGRPVGLLAVAGRDVELSTLDALAGIAAIAVERVQFLEERKTAEVERRSAELKSALLASLAHDLRTPLTAIRVAASNVQGAWATDADRQSQSEIVLAEVERLNRLFQNILDMARIETKGVTAAPEWVAPEEIVEAAVAQVQQTLGRHHVVTNATDREVVYVDPRLTSSALAHLVENAAQYSPPDTTIRISASAGADRLEIVVEDEGPGIAQADIGHLFERFFRGQAATRRSTGAGMGLAISRGLLAAESGTVWGENRPAGGARFVINVPAAMRPVVAESE
jgi:two-component system, OmpR family, sensor histidine kinase KdpD